MVHVKWGFPVSLLLLQGWPLPCAVSGSSTYCVCLGGGAEDLLTQAMDHQVEQAASWQAPHHPAHSTACLYSCKAADAQQYAPLHRP
jgi:hypothetical protein